MESISMTERKWAETKKYTVGTDPTVYMSDVCKSVDYGIPLGLSYEYKNIVLDARYFFGLTKIDKTDNPDSARNQYLSITLGYKFNL